MTIQVLSLDTWPFAASLLFQLAQESADDRLHATATGAHVASVLLEMQPVREILGGANELERLDAAVGRALLLTPKGFGKSASFDGHLGQILTGGARKTADVLGVAGAGTAAIAEVHAAVAHHADAIGALLDAPPIAELFAAVTSRKPEHMAARQSCPHLVNAYVQAQRRKHRRVTTRHVIAARLRSFETVLTERGLPWNGDVTARLDLLLEQEPQHRDGSMGVKKTPRLVGAVAAAVAQPGDDLDFALLRGCFVGDANVAFVKAGLNDAIRRMVESTDATPERPQSS